MWIESHQELGSHPKTKRLARRLGISLPAVVGHLHYLWWWAMDYAEDGDLTKFTPDDLADAMLWEGDPASLVDALVDCGVGGGSGFLDRLDDGRLLIHNWEEYAGRLIQHRENNKERVRRWRQANATAKDENVTRNERVAYDPTVPNLTVPNQTIPNTTMERLFAPAAQTSETPTSKPIKPKREPKPPPTFEETSDEYRITARVVGILKARDPGIKAPAVGCPAFQKWCEPVRKLLKRRTAAEVARVLDWLPTDDFWPSVVLSTSGLEDHFDAMYAKVLAPARPAYNGKTNGRDQTRWPKIEMPKRPNVLHADGTITDADGNLIGREQDGVVIWN